MPRSYVKIVNSQTGLLKINGLQHHGAPVAPALGAVAEHQVEQSAAAANVAAQFGKDIGFAVHAGKAQIGYLAAHAVDAGEYYVGSAYCHSVEELNL